MSYSSDSCKTTFTAGQLERMLAIYENYRYDSSARVASTPDDSSKDDSKLFQESEQDNLIRRRRLKKHTLRGR
jgi:hypothetical protein